MENKITFEKFIKIINEDNAKNALAIENNKDGPSFIEDFDSGILYGKQRVYIRILELILFGEDKK